MWRARGAKFTYCGYATHECREFDMAKNNNALKTQALTDLKFDIVKLKQNPRDISKKKSKKNLST